MPSNIEDLRDHLFETIKALRDPENPMDLDRAKTVGVIADRIIETAKVEVDAMRITRKSQSRFIPLLEVTGPGVPGLPDISKTK